MEAQGEHHQEQETRRLCRGSQGHRGLSWGDTARARAGCSCLQSQSAWDLGTDQSGMHMALGDGVPAAGGFLWTMIGKQGTVRGAVGGGRHQQKCFFIPRGSCT